MWNKHSLKDGMYELERYLTYYGASKSQCADSTYGAHIQCLVGSTRLDALE